MIMTMKIPAMMIRIQTMKMKIPTVKMEDSNDAVSNLEDSELEDLGSA